MKAQICCDRCNRRMRDNELPGAPCGRCEGRLTAFGPVHRYSVLGSLVKDSYWRAFIYGLIIGGLVVDLAHKIARSW